MNFLDFKVKNLKNTKKKQVKLTSGGGGSLVLNLLVTKHLFRILLIVTSMK